MRTIRLLKPILSIFIICFGLIFALKSEAQDNLELEPIPNTEELFLAMFGNNFTVHDYPLGGYTISGSLEEIAEGAFPNTCYALNFIERENNKPEEQYTCPDEYTWKSYVLSLREVLDGLNMKTIYVTRIEGGFIRYWTVGITDSEVKEIADCEYKAKSCPVASAPIETEYTPEPVEEGKPFQIKAVRDTEGVLVFYFYLPVKKQTCSVEYSDPLLMGGSSAATLSDYMFVFVYTTVPVVGGDWVRVTCPNPLGGAAASEILYVPLG